MLNPTTFYKMADLLGMTLSLEKGRVYGSVGVAVKDTPYKLNMTVIDYANLKDEDTKASGVHCLLINIGSKGYFLLTDNSRSNSLVFVNSDKLPISLATLKLAKCASTPRELFAYLKPGIVAAWKFNRGTEVWDPLPC
jgi:hypothetical protein